MSSTGDDNSGSSGNKDALLRNPVFWVSIATITVGLFKYVVSYMLKSKCSDFSLCWGAIKIKRDIEVERDIEIATINAGRTTESDEKAEEELPPPLPISLPGSRRPSRDNNK